MFGSVARELTRGSKTLVLEPLQLHAVRRLMQHGGHVRRWGWGDTHKPFLFLVYTAKTDV